MDSSEQNLETVVESAAPSPPMARSLVAPLLKGSAIYALANVAVKALSFLLLPLYTRFLTPADYGIISLAEILAMVAVSILGLGLEPSLARFFFQHAGDAEAQRTYVSTVIRFGLFVLLAGIALLLLLGASGGQFLREGLAVSFFPYVALALASAAATQAFQYPLTLFQAQMRPRAYAVLSIASFFLTMTAVISLVVIFPHGAAGMLWGKFGAAAFAALIALALSRSWLKARFVWRYVRETLPVSLPLVPHQLMALGLVVADRFILQHYRPLSEVGIYSLAYTCGMAMFLVSSSILQAFSPIYFEAARAGAAARRPLARLAEGVVSMWGAIAVAGIFVSPFFARILDARYEQVGRLIPLVIAAYLLHALFTLFQLQTLEGGKTRFVLYASSIALLVNLSLNLLWIPRWGMYGAAYATVVGYAVEALVMFAGAQRTSLLPYQQMRLLGTLTISAAVVLFSQSRWSVAEGRGAWRPLAALAISAALFLVLSSSQLRSVWQSVRGASAGGGR